MKSTLILICLLLGPLALTAQICEPDTTFPDTVAGVFPAPITDENPDGGIDKVACIGEYFEYTLTVIIPDSAVIFFGGFPLEVDLISAQINQEGAIEGLPPGIDYSCMPEECIFPSESTGCLLLYGTVEEGTTPMKYPLSMVIQITVDGIGTIDVDYPGPQFPGEYFLEVASSDSSACRVSATQDAFESNILYPNPLHRYQILNTNQSLTTDWLEIRDLNGRLMQRMTSIPENLSLSHFPEGLYLVRSREGNRIHHQKLLVID